MNHTETTLPKGCQPVKNKIFMQGILNKDLNFHYSIEYWIGKRSKRFPAPLNPPRICEKNKIKIKIHGKIIKNNNQNNKMQYLQ